MILETFSSISRTTYIYPISGANLYNSTTIVALEYCFRERGDRVGQTRDHFDFFTLVESENDPNILETTYSATATSTVTCTNCSNMQARDTVVSCSYQILPSPPSQTNVRYVGITNLRVFPTLLRLPNGYSGIYYTRIGNTAIDYICSEIDKQQLTPVDGGDLPVLRIHYRKLKLLVFILYHAVTSNIYNILTCYVNRLSYMLNSTYIQMM